ncbi:Zn(2)-C6 fungal-type domain-containing protein [Favolaschia claudopus]|uniref:Zn(2)-C6 fungal-type domain-containing protein n=1 Tax=Favolaschia claudopus TaxID=2862362 RepID=A0AAW0ABC6_9AGAR
MEPPPTVGLLYLPMTEADGQEAPIPGSKRRRLKGACDACRARKVRCDSARQPNNVCSNCISFNVSCTHNGTTKSDASKQPVSGFAFSTTGHFSMDSANAKAETDISTGKTAQDHVEAILVQSTAYIAAEDLRNVLLDIARYSRKLEQEIQMLQARVSNLPAASALSAPSPSNTTSSNDDSTDSSPDGIMALVDDLKAMHLVNPNRITFHGRSSGLYLIKTAQALRAEHDGPNVKQPEPTRRKEFWSCPWEVSPPPPSPIYRFPPQDLMEQLISIYFTRLNILTALLHRPSFEKSLAAGLHAVDPAFGSVVLAVCALASRYCDDPRVILKGTNTKLSSGWEWFQQIRYPNREFHLARTIHDLQRYALCILYLQGTASPEACWIYAAIGLRNLQDIGVHISKVYRGYDNDGSTLRTIEDELYTRVFWILMAADMLMSAFIGRPRLMKDEDYDIDYPVAVDDEFWDHPDPTKRFKQPEGKPSVYAFMTPYLKLLEILGAAQRTIYSVKRAQRSQATVAELDSLLNGWVDTIPDHLRWDPHREDEPFATQSACLYASYYHVQIQIHRTFIPSPMNDASLSSTFPSLAICANSARSCSRVMEIQARRSLVAHPQVVNALMDSAIVILLNVWGAGRTGITVDPQRAINDVHKCISVLKMYERHWQAAGKYCDMLFTVGKTLITNPPSAEFSTRKHARGGPEPVPRAMPPPSSRAMSISSVTASASIHPHTESQDLASYSLPLSTEELGTLPVYHSFDWSVPFGNFAPDSDFGHTQPQYMFNFNHGNQDTHTGSSSDASSNYASYIDWATRDWTTYVDSVDQILRSFEGQSP